MQCSHQAQLDFKLAQSLCFKPKNLLVFCSRGCYLPKPTSLWSCFRCNGQCCHFLPLVNKPYSWIFEVEKTWGIVHAVAPVSVSHLHIETRTKIQKLNQPSIQHPVELVFFGHSEKSYEAWKKNKESSSFSERMQSRLVAWHEQICLSNAIILKGTTAI